MICRKILGGGYKASRIKAWKERYLKRLISAFVVLAIFAGMLYQTGFQSKAKTVVNVGKSTSYPDNKVNSYFKVVGVPDWSSWYEFELKQTSSTTYTQGTFNDASRGLKINADTSTDANLGNHGNHQIQVSLASAKTLANASNGVYETVHFNVSYILPAHYVGNGTTTECSFENSDNLSAIATHSTSNRRVTGWAKCLVFDCALVTMNQNRYRNVIIKQVNLKRPTWTLTCDTNGGSGGFGAATRSCGTNVGDLTAPTRVGFNFKGWSSSATGSVNISSSTMVCENKTLYAVWEKKKATYTYNANGGSGDMGSTVINYGESEVLSKNAFTRSGYVFKGWATSPTGNVVYLDEDEVSHSEDTNPTITLYAVWEQKEDTYNFHANGGTISSGPPKMPPLYVASGETKNLFSCGYTKTGYTFAGWSTSEDDTTISYADQASVSKALDDTTEKTYDLYAVWEPNTCTVVYSKNGGKGTQIANSSVKYNTPSLTLPACTYTRPGYTFLGWSTQQRGNVQYNNKQTISVAPWIETGSKTVTLYAVWKRNDANFNTDKVQKDKGMFQNDTKLKGQNGTSYDSNKTGSEYANHDKEGKKGYFSEK